MAPDPGPPAAPLVAWPGWRHLKRTLVLTAGFLAIFYLIYGTTSWFTGLHGRRLRVDFDFETSWPFVPAAAVVYLSLGLLFLLVPWILRRRDEVVPLFLTLLGETVIAGFAFLLFPTASGYGERRADGAFAPLFHLADALNLDHNELPSLHVAFAFTLALVLGRPGERWSRTLLLVWASAIAASALLLHEHHLADVVGGLALAVLGVLAVRTVSAVPGLGSYHRPDSSRSFLRAWRIEWICMGEFARFIRRHRRYGVLFLVIYGHSLPRWRRTRLLRAGYCLAQHVDDVLDGDRVVGTPPDEYVSRLIDQIEDDGEPTTAMGCVARFVVAELAALGDGQEDPKGELLALFEVLRFDCRRREEGLVLRARDLAEHHRKTFYYSLDLTLRVTGSRLRADCAGGLVDALSWCSPLRDLGEDLDRGLVNVPREVVLLARKEGASSLGYDELVKTRAVRQWMEREYGRGLASLAAAAQELQGLPAEMENDPGKRVLELFTAAIRRYAERYGRRHRRLFSTTAVPCPATPAAKSPPHEVSELAERGL